MRNHRYVHGRGKDLEGGALAMDIQGIREGALFAMHNMQDVWSFLIYRVHLLASMPVCYIYRQQEGRQAELPKGRRDFKMATLDVTEERRRAIDRVNRAYADEDYDRYERLIERYCHRFGFDGDYGLFEDACTDARIFGHGIG